MILVTGSSGLIGRHLVKALGNKGIDARSFDIRNTPLEDITNAAAVEKALQGVAGIVHLAAVSRVIWAERDPALCQAVNVEALRKLLHMSLERPFRPWVIFASSREVYGQSLGLPVSEDDPLIPMNVYAHSKVQGERLIEQAQKAGLNAVICRFSNVYGCVHDHADRVVMAFAKAAATGGVIRMEGASHLFDFTAVDDVVSGLLRLIGSVEARELPPPIHFVSGVGTTLLELANIASDHAFVRPAIEKGLERDFDVARFIGNPDRATRLLGWKATTPLSSGLPKLIEAMRAVPNRPSIN